MLAQAMARAIESGLCASMVLATAFAATLTMRRAAASTRHWVWSCAIVGALLSPLTIALLPKWEVGPVAGLERVVSVLGPANEVASGAGNHSSDPRARSTGAAAPPKVSSGFHPLQFVAFLWASGTVAILLYAFLGFIAQWRIRRSAESPPVKCVDQLRLLAEIHDVRRPIGIAESDCTSTPIVSGFWNPLIILPRAAADWTPERLRVVLTHELAHIKRGDCFTQRLAWLACAAYWFNPLAWIAVRRLRVEQERACDDFVLASGTKASAYASHLSEIARRAHPNRPSLLAAGTLAMARGSQMEGRLLAILDPAIQRSSGSGSRASGAALVLLVTIALGSLQIRPSGAAIAVAAAPSASKSVVNALLIEAAGAGQIDAVRDLLRQGADIDASLDGENALVAAAHQGQEKTAELLLDRGADVNAAPGHWTALIAAAHQGQVETVRLLLDRGADVNAEVGDWTALIAAAHQGQERTVGLLLDRGADMNAAPGGWSALATAVRRGRRDVMSLLVERAAGADSRMSMRARE
jgi:beta-lactamase regulating signal transducer with metallopeptidase domain